MKTRTRALVVGLAVGLGGLAIIMGERGRASSTDARLAANSKPPPPRPRVAGDEAVAARFEFAAKRASHGASESIVVGHVVDRDEGPLAEGSVQLDCPDGASLGRAAIDEEGWFEAPACPRSPTCVRLIHPGSVQPQAWQLDAGEPVELEVDPAARVSGIVSADGRAIADARVVARRGDRRWTTSTDVEGHFMLALGERPDPGSACEFEPSTIDHAVAVVVQASGHPPWAGTLLADDEPLNIELAEPGPSLIGTLRDGEGRGFDRTRVLASSRDRPDEGHVAWPDPSGQFEFDELGEGVYRLRAIRDGVEVALGQGEAGAKTVMVSTLSARGPTLELDLRDEAGEPMSGVRVDGGPFQAARSDEAGQVRATDVFAGAYDLRLRSPTPECGVSRERIEIPADEEGQPIRIELRICS